MSLAALFSGLALANAGLGVVHGFAAPLGGRFPAPHGAVCAAILPYGMEINLRALRARAPKSAALGRYQEVARMLTGRPDATAEDGIVWTREICRELEIPPLKAYGIGEQDVPALIAEAAKASSMKANPLALTPEELGRDSNAGDEGSGIAGCRLSISPTKRFSQRPRERAEARRSAFLRVLSENSVTSVRNALKPENSVIGDTFPVYSRFICRLRNASASVETFSAFSSASTVGLSARPCAK